MAQHLAMIFVHRRAGFYGGGDGFFGARQAFAETPNHHLDRDMLGRVVAPAVVIGDDGQSRVAKLRLARQKRLGRACHSDDIGADGITQKETFGARSEPRPFDAGESRVGAQNRAFFRGGARQ